LIEVAVTSLILTGYYNLASVVDYMNTSTIVLSVSILVPVNITTDFNDGLTEFLSIAVTVG